MLRLSQLSAGCNNARMRRTPTPSASDVQGIPLGVAVQLQNILAPEERLPKHEGTGIPIIRRREQGYKYCTGGDGDTNFAQKGKGIHTFRASSSCVQFKFSTILNACEPFKEAL